MKLHSTAHGIPRDSSEPSEDAFRVQSRDDRVIAVLADGLGSSKEGGPAAHRAVAMMTDYYLARPQGWSPRRALSEFAAQINRMFFQESQLRYGSPEILCTLGVIVVEGRHLYGFNVGDSPVYHWRRGAITLLSHSHVVDQPGFSHVLTRALGLEATVDPHFFELTLEEGDIVLLCSDGVSNALPVDTLSRLLASGAAARSVVASAGEAIAENPDLADDASAIVLGFAELGWAGETTARSLEVLPGLRTGEQIDGHRLIRSLDPGERVWLAEQNDGALHVLKFPPLEAREDETRRDGFIRELWQATRIDSPDFVRARVPTEGTLRYYVMDYVNAPTLREKLAAGPLRVEDAVVLGRFLLGACQFLLSRDYAHGDIKPDNILVLATAETGLRFQLLDLGSAAEVFSVTSRAGTPSYLAPERFRNAALSERTEIFAIGVTLYEALSRSYPYGEVERFQTPRFESVPKSLMRLNPAVPAWLESIIMRALSPDADRRYQNFSEMVYDLDHPEQVRPCYRKDAPLLERNPLLFYKVLCLLLLLVNIGLVVLLSGRP
jgi:serine/threonine protein phosphatase PrpC